MARHHPDLIMCRKQPGIAIGRLCEKCAWRARARARSLARCWRGCRGGCLAVPPRRCRAAAALPPPPPPPPPADHLPASHPPPALALACPQATASAPSATRTCAPPRSCACATSATTAATRCGHGLRGLALPGSVGVLLAAAAAAVAAAGAWSRPEALPRSDPSPGLPLPQGRCVICGGIGVSDAYYCKECTIQEKDVSWGAAGGPAAWGSGRLGRRRRAASAPRRSAPAAPGPASLPAPRARAPAAHGQPPAAPAAARRLPQDHQPGLRQDRPVLRAQKVLVQEAVTSVASPLWRCLYLDGRRAARRRHGGAAAALPTRAAVGPGRRARPSAARVCCLPLCIDAARFLVLHARPARCPAARPAVCSPLPLRSPRSPAAAARLPAPAPCTLLDAAR